jgi:polyhydroxybutyrate depolymerase
MRVIGGVIAFVLLLAVVALFAFHRFGRAGTEAAAATMQERAVEVHGDQRTFSVCLPGSYAPGRNYPIVVLLHGGGIGSGHLIAMQTGICDYVERDQFIAVLPNAQFGHWNDGRASTASSGDDVAFLRAAVRTVASEFGADPSRAFIAGISNGGMMALRMACEATDTFRAYAAVVANLPEELSARCRPSKPVPALFILSRDDPGMPWAGGQLGAGMQLGGGPRPALAAGGRVLSGPDTVNVFAQVNGCAEATVTRLPDRAKDGTSVRLHTYRCSRSPVVLYELRGAGHGWPGSRVERPARFTQMFGIVSQDIDATEVIVDFFKQNGLAAPRSWARPGRG